MSERHIFQTRSLAEAERVDPARFYPFLSQIEINTADSYN